MKTNQLDETYNQSSLIDIYKISLYVLRSIFSLFMRFCYGFCVRIHFFTFISTYSLDGCIDVVKDVYDNMDYNGSRTEAKYWIYRIYKI